jgi:hypothetical protein
VIGRFRRRPVGRFGLPIGAGAGTGGVLMRPRDRGIDADVPADQPGGVRASLQAGHDLRPDTGPLPAAKQRIHGLPRAQRGTHRSVRALNADIRTWIKTWNDNPRPYVWTKTADQILDSIKRYCTRINDSQH